ncbi:MAG: LysR family transcriptional regulator [Rhodobacteraceae bacterium]|nr:LysR family transcriptional regulator [Paracoccaceae bacterium]NKB29782.1 LysR family transcriptional regulator [Paracoccaceae bacterium]
MRHAQLRAFHNVAIHGGFSRAAEALSLTQPALSDQVRKLEAEYDIRLFDRSRKQIEITQAGSRLLEITRRLFEIEDLARDMLSESRSLRSGTLRIVSDTPYHIVELLAAFRARYPGVQVSVRSGNSAEVSATLASYEADIGVLGEIPSGSEYDVIDLSQAPLIAFVSAGSPLSDAGDISLGDLARSPLVLRETGSRTRSKLEEAFAAARLKPSSYVEAEGREAVREIVAAGGGVGIVSEAEFGTDTRLVALPIRDANLLMDEALVCLRERRDSRMIRAFMGLAAG